MTIRTPTLADVVRLASASPLTMRTTRLLGRAVAAALREGLVTVRGSVVMLTSAGEDYCHRYGDHICCPGCNRPRPAADFRYPSSASRFTLCHHCRNERRKDKRRSHRG